jgi:hypothetical protein
MTFVESVANKYLICEHVPQQCCEHGAASINAYMTGEQLMLHQ